MRIVKIVGLVLVVLVVVFVGIGLLLPSQFHVEREVVIDAPPEVIHQLVADLTRWPEWQPWTEEDPTIQTTLGSVTSGVGANQTWTGESGSGALEITYASPESGVEYDLEFTDQGMKTRGAIRYEPAPGGTRVVWAMDGSLGNNPFMRYFGLMLDGAVGPMFERGLAKLKTQAEELARAAPEPEPETGAAAEEASEAS